MRKDDGLVLEKINLIHESMVRSEWTTIINEINPKLLNSLYEVIMND